MGDTIKQQIALLATLLLVFYPRVSPAFDFSSDAAGKVGGVSEDLSIADISKPGVPKVLGTNENPPQELQVSSIDENTTKDQIQTPENTNTQTIDEQQTQEEDITSIQETIRLAARQYEVDEEMMLKIAECESGFRQNAVNGPYGGIFQFLATTFSSNRRAMGLNADPDLRFDAAEAAKTAAFKMSRDGFGAWPACSNKALEELAIAG